MRAGNKPCELLYDTLLLCVVYPHVSHVDTHEEDVEFESPTLVEGLPGVGLVGKIAVDHLVETFDMQHYARFTATDYRRSGCIVRTTPRSDRRFGYTRTATETC